MAKIKFTCPHCGKLLQCDEKYGKIKCRHCKQLIVLSEVAVSSSEAPVKRQSKKKIILASIALASLAAIAMGIWFVFSATINWPDRRPIGVLFLASNFHSS